jgi:oleandomycin transport system permease protein
VAVPIGITAKDPERVQVYGFTALFPVTMVSNVFVPAETMPGWLQAFVNVNPVSILSDAARGMMLGEPCYSGSVATPVLQSLAWAAAIAVVFAPLSVRAFKRRV